jgi:hypothetical protein
VRYLGEGHQFKAHDLRLLLVVLGKELPHARIEWLGWQEMLGQFAGDAALRTSPPCIASHRLA